MIKLIVSDMDGTLLSNDKKINLKDVEALKYANEKGVKFIVASGRNYDNIERVLKDYDIDVYAYITGNGAEIFDKDKKLIQTCYFDKSLYFSVSKIFAERDVPFMVFTTNGIYANDPDNVKNLFRIRNNIKNNTVGQKSYLDEAVMHTINNVDDFLKEDLDIIKLEAFTFDLDLIKDSKDELSKIDGISYLSSYNDNIEVTSEYAQKGHSLIRYIDHLNIKEDEAMVIGDGENDLSMFELFKYSYAPLNSIDKIKEIAYKVVCLNNEGAVSQAIYDLI